MDDDFEVSHLSHIQDATSHTISWYRGGQPPADLKPGIVIAHDDLKIDHVAKVVVYHKNPRLVFRDTIVKFGFDIPPEVTRGEGCRIHPSAVLGADGQGYDWEDARWNPFPHAGNLRIGNNVDVGPCATIMRGSIGDTAIDDGTRIGNSVNIGHDARIGKNVLIIAHASVAGWVQIDDGVKIWQGALIKNGIHIGRGAQIAMGSVVLCDIPAEQVWAGNPARQIR